MKILMINKFLYPKGGAEAYMLRLGRCLEERGHQVEYFGMAHRENVVGNCLGLEAAYMDPHSGTAWEKLRGGLRSVLSRDAAKKLRPVLEAFQPDVCHLNNFHYQLTPAILLEIDAWRRSRSIPCRVIYTAHDLQLICPNHMCYDPVKEQNCEKCLGGRFGHCVANRCIHGSLAKSLLGTVEACVWNGIGVYRLLDRVICCSAFLQEKLNTNPVLRHKTVLLPNFVEAVEAQCGQKQPYVLYFGRYTREKGLLTLLEAAKELPQIPFYFAGAGPLQPMIGALPNGVDLGFLSGEELKIRVRQARLSVCPSLIYENCPFSVLESLSLGTPVLAARTGGIPELIWPGENGDLFAPGDAEDLRRKLLRLYQAEDPFRDPGEIMTLSRYIQRLEEYYGR